MVWAGPLEQRSIIFGCGDKLLSGEIGRKVARFLRFADENVLVISEVISHGRRTAFRCTYDEEVRLSHSAEPDLQVAFVEPGIGENPAQSRVVPGILADQIARLGGRSGKGAQNSFGHISRIGLNGRTIASVLIS